MGWRHFTSPVEEKVEDALFGVASQFVSYCLRRTEYSGAVLDTKDNDDTRTTS